MAAKDRRRSDSRQLNLSAAAFGQVPEQTIQRQQAKARRKLLPENLVLRWIMQAWSNIPKEMVRRSFKTCGNSNALDGTEDDAIYNCPQIDANDEQMKEEFDTDSKDDDER